MIPPSESAKTINNSIVAPSVINVPERLEYTLRHTSQQKSTEKPLENAK